MSRLSGFAVEEVHQDDLVLLPAEFSAQRSDASDGSLETTTKVEKADSWLIIQMTCILKGWIKS
jgi:hypothetical protein